MKTISLTLLIVSASLAAGCSSPTVIQGTVLSYDQTAKAIVVQDENVPHAEMSISAANADIGADPRTGDVVRIAYRDESGFLRATRVMNLTRQEELKKGKSGH